MAGGAQAISLCHSFDAPSEAVFPSQTETEGGAVGSATKQRYAKPLARAKLARFVAESFCEPDAPDTSMRPGQAGWRARPFRAG